jgi:SAM-dependent MidA family methyltransferase
MRTTDSTLPVPDADGQAHSARVVAHIRDEIARDGGFISFARYMELALYAPSLGYYVAGARKLGGGGDFVTGPELTPLYGAAIARQLAVFLEANGAREIIELGAGSGALAASVLPALAAHDAPLAHYRILEVSPGLRAQQQATIGSAANAAHAVVEWLDRLPDRIDGVVLMNEVLDAIAPRLVARRDRRWFERGVTWRDDALQADERPLDDDRLRAIAEARFPPTGDYASEINVAAEALVATIARRVGAGVLLIVDYGFPRHEYYHVQRHEGTLVGHYRHRVHGDPLLWPGLSDLTAHVDFTAIAEAGERAGMLTAGFATQASFLIGCGILDLLNAVGAPDSPAYLRAASAVQKLVSPAEMGELFKVLLLSRGQAKRRSLAVTDMTHRL